MHFLLGVLPSLPQTRVRIGTAGLPWQGFASHSECGRKAVRCHNFTRAGAAGAATVVGTDHRELLCPMLIIAIITTGLKRVVE